ncbi:MAG: hypothetical protein AAF490_22345 [Chloroflexota bacterium]
MPHEIDHLIESHQQDSGIALFDVTAGIYTSGKGRLTKISGFGGKYCTETRVAHLCGSSSTGNNGQRILTLTDFTCIEYESPGAGDGYEHLAPPVYFVATPYTTVPAMLTFVVEIENQSPHTKINISVHSWDSNGQPHGNVKFNWHCCVQHILINFS